MNGIYRSSYKYTKNNDSIVYSKVSSLEKPLEEIVHKTNQK